jgi:hypothetical protein
MSVEDQYYKQIVCATCSHRFSDPSDAVLHTRATHSLHNQVLDALIPVWRHDSQLVHTEKTYGLKSEIVSIINKALA